MATILFVADFVVDGGVFVEELVVGVVFIHIISQTNRHPHNHKAVFHILVFYPLHFVVCLAVAEFFSQILVGTDIHQSCCCWILNSSLKREENGDVFVVLKVVEKVFSRIVNLF